MITALGILLASRLSFAQMQFLQEQHTGRGSWAEEVTVIKMAPREYHPFLRMYGENKFMLETPAGLIANGHYSVNDTAVTFTPELVEEINHADADKLLADSPAEIKKEWMIRYDRAMAPVPGTWSEDHQTLTVNIFAEGLMKTYNLHPLEYGDEARSDLTDETDHVFPNTWFGPEPYAERLDSKDRYRIGGVDGLRQFSKEAEDSDGNQFNLLDLRKDRTYRVFGDDGRWHYLENKHQLELLPSKGGKRVFDVSPDFRYLSIGGKRAFQRF